MRQLVALIKSFIRFKKNSWLHENALYLEGAVVFNHACRTPLTIALCNLELISGYSKLPKQHVSQLLRVRAALETLEKLISYKLGALREKSRFEVFTAVLEVVALLQTKSNGITLEKNPQEELLILGSKLYFQEALSCILKNALEAYDKAEAQEVTILVRKTEMRIQIHIVDYGQGMDGVTRFFAFSKGLTAKKNGQGVGLAFAKQTIEQLFGGKLILISKAQCGTRAIISLPVLEPRIQSHEQFE